MIDIEELFSKLEEAFEKQENTCRMRKDAYLQRIEVLLNYSIKELDFHAREALLKYRYKEIKNRLDTLLNEHILDGQRSIKNLKKTIEKYIEDKEIEILNYKERNTLMDRMTGKVSQNYLDKKKNKEIMNVENKWDKMIMEKIEIGEKMPERMMIYDCDITNISLEIQGEIEDIISNSKGRIDTRQKRLKQLLSSPSVYYINEGDKLKDADQWFGDMLNAKEYLLPNEEFNQFLKDNMDNLINSENMIKRLSSKEECIKKYSYFLETSYKKGYQEGYDKGYKKGYDEGYDKGYDVGYSRGYDDGYADG